MNILIIGGAGFVGCNLANSLCRQGNFVRIYDNFLVGRRHHVSFAPGTEAVEGDIGDSGLLRQSLRGMDVVVHLAARTGVQQSMKHPVENFEVNVTGTVKLLEAARVCQIGKVVFASSNAALGVQESPMRETQVPRPVSPYGASKLAAEAYCLAYHASYGLSTVVLRFSNVYGPFSAHKTSVVSTFIRRALTGQSLVVHGEGKQTRDFIFVDDVCRAIELALHYEVGGSVFQIGTGEETSVLDLAHAVGSLCRSSPEIVFAPTQKDDIKRNYSSIEMARSLLGFQPKTKLADGLGRTVDWFTGILRREIDR